MIKHIVIFKLTPPYTLQEKEEGINRLCEIFEPLGKKLIYPKEYTVKKNILEAEHAGDVVINSLFTTPEDLERYKSSNEHKAAVAEASLIRKTKIVVDYIV